MTGIFPPPTYASGVTIFIASGHRNRYILFLYMYFLDRGNSVFKMFSVILRHKTGTYAVPGL